MRKIKRITGVDGIRNGGRPRVKLPVNERYFGIYAFVKLDGVKVPVTDVISRVRLFVNGITMWDAPTGFFLGRTLREGRTLKTGVLPLEFADPARADKIDEQVLAWNLFGQTSFELELEIRSDLGAKVPDIQLLRIVDQFFSAVDGKPITQCVRITTLGKNCVAGVNDIDNLPTRDPLQRITFFGVQPVEFRVDLDGETVIEAPVDSLDDIYSGHGHVRQDGATTLRFDYTERLEDFLKVGRSLNIKATTEAAGAMDMVLEAISGGFN